MVNFLTQGIRADAHTARAGLARISKQWGLQGFFEFVIFVFKPQKHAGQIFKRLGKFFGGFGGNFGGISEVFRRIEWRNGAFSEVSEVILKHYAHTKYIYAYILN